MLGNICLRSSACSEHLILERNVSSIVSCHRCYLCHFACLLFFNSSLNYNPLYVLTETAELGLILSFDILYPRTVMKIPRKLNNLKVRCKNLRYGEFKQSRVVSLEGYNAVSLQNRKVLLQLVSVSKSLLCGVILRKRIAKVKIDSVHLSLHEPVFQIFYEVWNEHHVAQSALPYLLHRPQHYASVALNSNIEILRMQSRKLRYELALAAAYLQIDRSSARKLTPAASAFCRLVDKNVIICRVLLFKILYFSLSHFFLL